MPYAYINGQAINPPYAPHTRGSWYDFHASILSYGWQGRSGGGTIKSGEKLTLYWLANSDEYSGRGADRYITCQIP
jgi:hypothetical protein